MGETPSDAKHNINILKTDATDCDMFTQQAVIATRRTSQLVNNLITTATKKIQYNNLQFPLWHRRKPTNSIYIRSSG